MEVVVVTDELTIDPEFAALLPDLSCIQLAQLESNLTTEGWRKEQAIILWANQDDIIVDGMNRYRLCRQLDIEFKTVARTFADREAVKEWILTNAYGQRNLTVEQESYCRGEVYNLRKKRHGGDRTDSEASGQNVHLKTSEQVAEQFGVDERTVRRDAKFADALDQVAEAGGADVKQAILSGAVKASKSDVIKLAKVDKKTQRRALKALDSGKADSIKGALRQAEQIIPIQQIAEEGATTTGDLDSLADRKFGCIYADPPWAYGNQSTRAATDNHYETMSIESLCAMPVASLAADDAHLHLWTTNAFIFEAKRLIDSWGFEYRSMFIWCKTQMGIGNYWRVSHEILLTAIRGDAKSFADKSLKSWGEFDRGKHSAKPEEVRAMIEKASPGPYLELFGRKPVGNWTVYGNQIESRLFA